ncbi:MAG TPA: DUF4157 domain-containing protein [Rhizomicrobium sp.]
MAAPLPRHDISRVPIADVAQRRAPNRTGLPDTLKAGLETLSGMSMDGVRVHYRSPEPARIDALAYTRGSDIHLAPGQERHLPHEAWHAVQQARGNVAPTTKAAGVAINDDRGLEHEADAMGAKAARTGPAALTVALPASAALKPGAVAQAMLSPPEAEALDEFLARLVVRVLTSLARQGVRLAPQASQTVMARIGRVRAEALAMDSLHAAKLHVEHAAAAALAELSKASPHDPAFSSMQSRHQPPRSQMERAGVLPAAMSATSPSPSFQHGGFTGAQLLREQDIHLQLFLRLHNSVQRVLRFVNRRNRGPQGLPLSEGLHSGHDMLGTVGRLSPMIARGDFVPTDDRRMLPMNWTTEEFIQERGADYDPEDLQAILQEIATHEHDWDLAGRAPVKYRDRLPTSPGHSIGLHAGPGGAVRLDFSEGRRILEQVSPQTPGEDLSYENIVRYLSQQSSAQLNTEVRRGYAAPSVASPFLRELLALLVGIEGTQNNVMALHAPMVTDLVAQGAIPWASALFTGQRQPRKEHIPYFAYAADKTQKGSSASSEGPMVRQSWLLQHGRFNEEHLRLDTLGDEDYLRQKALYDHAEAGRKARRQARIDEALARDAEAIAAEIAGRLAGMPEGERNKVTKSGQNIAEARVTAEVKRRYRDEAAVAFDADYPQAPAPVPNPELERAEGYKTFKNEYMQRQFDLQERFIREIFPQVATLRFLTREHFLQFCQKLFERYMLQRFHDDEWREQAAELDAPPAPAGNIIIHQGL